MLLRRVSESGRRDVRVRWRYFSLTQVNNRVEGWTIWAASDGDPAARGRLAFQAAEAARRQGCFEKFHWALLRARHEQRRDLDDPAVVEDVAADACLDVARFQSDLGAPEILDSLATDHQQAVRELGVFGTPTFHLPGSGSAYVRVRPAPAGEAALQLFDQLVRVIADEPYLLELKRPRRPEVRADRG